MCSLAGMNDESHDPMTSASFANSKVCQTLRLVEKERRSELQDFQKIEEAVAFAIANFPASHEGHVMIS